MELHADAVAAGTSLLRFETVGSTNAEALARGRAGTRGPLWIVAAEQTAGRGRRNRAWMSGRGNLYASLLVTDAAPVAQVAQISFVAALAVHDAVAEAAPALAGRLTLKWPNDVLGDGRKLAGILIEGEGARPLLTVVGVGINCLHHPEATEFPATSLSALGAAVESADLFTALSRHMALRLRQWDHGRDFAAIREAWMARAFAAGTMVRARLPERDLIGRFETLDRDGRLVLQDPDGSVHRIAAGDVFPVSMTGPDVTSESA